jgi:hypothetical protein
MAKPEQSYLRLGAAIVVVFVLAIATLIVRSSGGGGPSASPSGASASGPSASAPPQTGGQGSPSNRASGSAGSGSGSAGTGSSGAGSAGTGFSGAGSTGTGSGGAGSAGSGSAGGGSAGVQSNQAAGPLPNTGAPFPWWLGLLPLGLGLAVIVALRRKAGSMRMLVRAPGGRAGGAAAERRGARSRTVPFSTAIHLRTPARVQRGEQWLPPTAVTLWDPEAADSPSGDGEDDFGPLAQLEAAQSS